MQDKNSENIRPLSITEPKVTILDEGKFFRIIIELPNMDEEKIRISFEHNPTLVMVIATNSTIQYKKIITFPCKLRFRKKHFFNGVLELILEKIKSNHSDTQLVDHALF